jgi:hypothetical protein
MALTSLKIQMFRFREDVDPCQPQCGKSFYIGKEIPGVSFTRGLPNHRPHCELSSAAVRTFLVFSTQILTKWRSNYLVWHGFPAEYNQAYTEPYKRERVYVSIGRSEQLNYLIFFAGYPSRSRDSTIDIPTG